MISIEPFFQPIVDLAECRTLGYEVLSRGSGPMRSPQELFECARRAGSIWELERACRVAALKAIAALPASIRDESSFFLNVSPDVFEDPRFVSGFTLAALADHGMSQSRIVIEITERTSIANYPRFEAAIRHYARQGFRIALDDFGSGHSGLVTLISCRPHFLKLDMAVTRDVHREPYKQKIVKSMVAFAANVGAELIAEGVESRDELESLLSYGVRFAQGFFLGRPAATPALLDEGIRERLSNAPMAVAV